MTGLQQSFAGLRNSAISKIWQKASVPLYLQSPSLRVFRNKSEMREKQLYLRNHKLNHMGGRQLVRGFVTRLDNW